MTGAVFRSYAPGDPGFTVRAQAYCLCAGGIENARLLLNFRSQAPKGIGNDHDLVGRYFNEHTGLYLGEVIFEEIVPDRRGRLLRHVGGLHGRARDADDLDGRDCSAAEASGPSAPNWPGRRSAPCPSRDRLVEAVSGRRPGRCDTGGLADYLRSLDPESNPWGQVYGVSELALNPESRVTLSDAVDALRPEAASG